MKSFRTLTTSLTFSPERCATLSAPAYHRGLGPPSVPPGDPRPIALLLATKRCLAMRSRQGTRRQEDRTWKKSSSWVQALRFQHQRIIQNDCTAVQTSLLVPHFQQVLAKSARSVTVPLWCCKARRIRFTAVVLAPPQDAQTWRKHGYINW